MHFQRFIDKVAVVTGAGSGIGRACAERFAQEGARVACLDVNDAGNEAVVESCRDLGAEAMAWHCDVSNEAEVTRVFEEILARWGRVDILVAAAGIYTGSPLPEVSLAQWRRLIDINLTGVFLCNRAVAPTMMAQRSGSIINISSMAGKTSFPASAEYSASKSGVIGLTRSVAMDLAPYGATANAICPGNTLTEMVRRVAGIVGAKEGLTAEQWLEKRAQDCPMKRLAEPWEIAGVAAFLASEDARYITGQAIEVDGGMVMC
ncbi:MAG: SDR family oxidoreductase [Chloroflexi bacterium]|nr:SDR family oxidoreductase [Chloroflexota bacterium]